MAINALRRRERIQFMTTMTLVHAIMHIGNTVAAAVSGGNAPSVDSLTKQVDSLKELMFPELAEEREERSKEARQILEEELGRGPIQVRSTVVSKKDRGRVRRSRRPIDAKP